jgi:CubicO group peptidase (beta-lactamase class C family)
MYVRAYGMADLEHRGSLTRESVLEVGAVAEQVTAAAVVLLAQQGRLSLDDEVRKYVGELPDFGHAITVRQLLTHVSGLRDSESLLMLRDRSPGRAVPTFEEVLHLIGRQRALNFVPGTEWLDSDSDYLLAALVVERVSGQSLPAFTDEHFFRPLRMTRTRWREHERRVVRDRARAYRSEEGGLVEDMPRGATYGAGGLLSSVDDLLAWNDALLTGRIEGGRALAAQLDASGALSSGALLDYGFGLEIGSRGAARELHRTGRTGGYASYLARFPDPQLSVAVLCNVREAEPETYGRRIAEFLLPPVPAGAAGPVAQVPRRDRVRVDAERLARLAGQYLDAARDRTIQIQASDRSLTIDEATFVATTQTRFESESAGVLEFELDGARVRRLTITDSRGTRTSWTLAPQTTPSADDLRAYEGSYTSAELGVDYVVRATGGRLELGFDPKRGRLPFAFVSDRAEALEPRYPDGFRAGESGVGIRFVRDRDRKVRGLRIFTEGARNVEFVRVQ